MTCARPNERKRTISGDYRVQRIFVHRAGPVPDHCNIRHAYSSRQYKHPIKCPSADKQLICACPDSASSGDEIPALRRLS